MISWLKIKSLCRKKLTGKVPEKKQRKIYDTYIQYNTIQVNEVQGEGETRKFTRTAKELLVVKY